MNHSADHCTDARDYHKYGAPGPAFEFHGRRK